MCLWLTDVQKSDIRNARDSLVKRGEFPSVDAVRCVVPNAGSTFAIRRYLKKLVAEDNSHQRFIESISKETYDMIEKARERIHREAVSNHYMEHRDFYRRFPGSKRADFPEE